MKQKNKIGNKLKFFIILASITVFVLLLISCGASKNELPMYGGDGETGITGNTMPDALDNLKLIYQADIVVETENYDDYMTALKAKVSELGGYISSSKEYTSGSDKCADMVIRVPSANYEALKQATAVNGEVISSSHEVIDVTESYMDIEGRLTSLRAQKSALDAMLEKATSVDTMLRIQKEIQNVNYEIESYQRQLNGYDNKIAYSTIDLRVTDEGEADTGIGWIVATIIIFVAPEAVLIVGIAVFLIIFFVKRSKNKKKKEEKNN